MGNAGFIPRFLHSGIAFATIYMTTMTDPGKRRGRRAALARGPIRGSDGKQPEAPYHVSILEQK